jgi:hypothetical protein
LWFVKSELFNLRDCKSGTNYVIKKSWFDHHPAVLLKEGKKRQEGSWLLTGHSVALGRGHHRKEFPIGHKGHFLMALTGMSLVICWAQKANGSIDSPRPRLTSGHEQAVSDREI